jgi:hypothetical protein
MDHHISRHLFKDPTLLTPIYLTDLEGYLKPSREEITEAIQKNIISDKLVNVHAPTTNFSLASQSDIISSVCGVMYQALSECINEMTGKGSNSGNCVFDYDLLNCWGAIYREGDTSKNHWHFPCTMSQVYYVNVGSDSCPIVFTDLDIEIVPESGKLITFPSYLMHSVPPLKKYDQRVVIAANWLFRERKRNVNFN